jgi:hypothetical protein
LAACGKSKSMKSLFLLLCTLLAFSVSVFSQDTLSKDLSRSLKRYELIKIDSSAMEQKARDGETIRVRAKGRNFDFDLVAHDLRAPNYRAVETNANGSYELQPDSVKTYRGHLRDDATSEVRVTIDGENLAGMIYTGDTKLFLTKAREFSGRAKKNDIVVYEEGDLTRMVDLTNDIPAQVNYQSESIPDLTTAYATLADLRQLEVATEADYQWVQAAGGDATTVNNGILSIMNMVDGIYRRDLGLTVLVTNQHAWTAADPYSSSSMSSLLDSFVAHWNSNFPRSQYPRDTAHLFTGKFSNQGLAYIGVVCRSPNSAYGLTGRSGGANHLIAAHEIGHNLGADHVDNSGTCASSMMNPSLSGSVTKFCSTSISAISSFVSQYGSCLTVVGTASTPLPTPLPTPIPTPFPTPIPTPFPTPIPTPFPTPVPTPIATPFPTPIPTPISTPVPTPSGRQNVASAVNGGSALTSSGVGSAAIDGNRVWSIGGAWKDITPSSYPDWIEIGFGGTRTIDEVDIFTVRDDYLSFVTPDLSTVASVYPLSAFDVQYWTGSTWANLPGGSVSGNNRVWKQLTFSPVSTSKIRVVVNAGAADGFSRIVEVEAWGGGGGSQTPVPTPTANPTPFPTPNSTPPATPSPVPTPSVRANVALASSGAVASASSALSAASAANDGVKSWAVSGSWKDSTPFAYPDWLQIDFNGTRTIDEIDIYGVRDDYSNTADPLNSDVSTAYSLINFDVQYWNGSGWVTVPGGNVNGNNLVVRKVTFSPISTSKIRVNVNSAQDGYSRIVEIEAWSGAGGGAGTPVPTPSSTPTIPPTPNSTPTARVNFARSTNGGSASASSELNSASSAIDGSLVWAAGGAWKDNSPSVYPDWLQVNFNGTKNIDEINIYAVMDDYLSTVQPTTSSVASVYGLTSFEVQYWTGSGWSAVPNGIVSGNNAVVRKFTFAPIATSAVRVLVSGAQDGYSRVVELEAWGS